MLKCLNLCEINWNIYFDYSGVIETLYELFEGVNRIYVGSYFCSQYFLSLKFNKLIEIARDRDMRITLVLPIFSEKDLDFAKEKISKLLQNSEIIIDEVTVNDFGMLSYVQGRFTMKVNLGRLFFKDPRDVRISEYYLHKGNVNTSSVLKNIVDISKINYIEIDETNRTVDVADVFNIAVHVPFCFMTTGNICKYASVNKSLEFKYRPNDKCGQECSYIYEHYSEIYNGTSIELYRVGRTVYSYMIERSNVKNKKREIYFPFIEIVNSVGGE